MWFWLKNIALLIALSIVAYLALKKPEVIINQNNVNQAAQGFSEFYESFRGEAHPDGVKISDYRIGHQDTSDKLTAMLKKRANMVTPTTSDWRGEVKSRRFRETDTIKKNMMAFAQEEGIELIWTLPRDYIVKHNFQFDHSFIDTLHQVGRALSSDFENAVLTYYCPQERAAVITDKANLHLLDYCIPTTLEASK